MKKNTYIYACGVLVLIIIGIVFYLAQTRGTTVIPEITLPIDNIVSEPIELQDEEIAFSDEDKIKIIASTLETKPGVEGLADLHNRFSHEIFALIDCNDFQGEEKSYCEEQQSYLADANSQIYWSQVVEKGIRYIENFDCRTLSFEADQQSCEQSQIITWTKVLNKGIDYAQSFDCDLIETEQGPQLCKEFQSYN